MPPFVAHLAHRMHIGPQTLVVDLGAGVGNVVLQLSLAAGCKSFGVEVMDKPADLAQVQLSEGRARSAMYSLDCGEMYLEKEDFCHSSTLSRKLPDADVVLINNCEWIQVVSCSQLTRPIHPLYPLQSLLYILLRRVFCSTQRTAVAALFGFERRCQDCLSQAILACKL